MKFNQAHPKNNLSNNVGTTVSFDEEYIHRHDIMMQEKNVVYDEEQRQKYTKIAKELSWIDRKENGYFIIVPKTIDDFKCEGKMQHNCVYTLRYYELVIKRQSIIVFSRKEADKPYITIEFDYETF